EEKFASDANMSRLGFITQPESNRNPDGLPIGLVVDDDPDGVSTALVKRSFLGVVDETPAPRLTNRWLGLTCAACHTADIEYGENVIRIDGGAAMADVQTFLSELSGALAATVENDEAFERFAKAVLEKAGTGY